MELRTLSSLPHWLVPSATVRIMLTYLWRHGRFPNLSDPRRFSELVQRRKLVDRNPDYPVLANKVAAKAKIGQLLGEDWIIPTLWCGTVLPRAPHWPYPFILKASHGCNQTIICHDAADWAHARRKAARWLDKPYGLWLDEWAYRDIPRGYIVEPCLGDDGRPPIDYKIYVFGGRATFVQVHLDRYSNHRWILYDRTWTQVSMFGEGRSAPPQTLRAMLAGAEAIARRFDFARIDFYEIDGRPKFGEVTFYPGSGLDPFDPPELDLAIGAQWLAVADMRDAERAPGALQPRAA